MAVVYPLTLPVNPAPISCTVTQASFTSSTMSPWSGTQQVQVNPGQLWGFSVAYPPMGDDAARNWFGILSALNGRLGTVLFGDPRFKAPRGNWGAGAVVSGAGQTGQALAVSGLPASAVIRAGDYFQLGTGSGSRLYVVTQDVTASAGGAATLDIWPRLRLSPANAAPIVTTRAVGVFRLTQPTVSRTFEVFRHGFSLELQEAL